MRKCLRARNESGTQEQWVDRGYHSPLSKDDRASRPVCLTGCFAPMYPRARTPSLPLALGVLFGGRMRADTYHFFFLRAGIETSEVAFLCRDFDVLRQDQSEEVTRKLWRDVRSEVGKDSYCIPLTVLKGEISSNIRSILEGVAREAFMGGRGFSAFMRVYEEQLRGEIPLVSGGTH